MCVANSARSQMAEGLAHNILGPDFHVESAGSNPTAVNPLAIQVMQEIGIDISNHRSKSIADLPVGFTGDLSYLITLCAEEACPAVVASATKLHWPFADPASHPGTDSEKLARFREVRDHLRSIISSFFLKRNENWGNI